MKFIEEIVVEQFLPTFRSMLAEGLRERGLTQSEVADLLGVSQSAVSKYAHGEVTRTDVVLEDERVRELAERLADGLASGEVSRAGALVEIEVLVRRLERGDLLARLHEAAMPELAARGGFGVHDPEGELRTAERALASVRRGLRTLEATSGFAGLIPNVGSNLVECLPDARGIDDVAGVPGRIFDVKGRATIPAEPEFGVSEHVARVLLAARASGSDARAALNVRYAPAIVERLRESGHRVVAFDAEADLDAAIADAFAGGGDAVETVRASGDGIDDAAGDDGTAVSSDAGTGADAAVDADVLYQTGAVGIEPVVYLLAPDAEEAATRIRELV
ncbi:DNA-binding protein [Halobacteriales archaeon QS_4_69_34]|nr:MAG: DNA-binding protein [Halobacteriales archaeon QS_4_69_34]